MKMRNVLALLLLFCGVKPGSWHLLQTSFSYDKVKLFSLGKIVLRFENQVSLVEQKVG